MRRILYSLTALLVGLTLSVTTPAHAVTIVTHLPSASQTTDWYRDSPVTRNAPIRYGIAGHAIVKHVGIYTSTLRPMYVTTLSFRNGVIYAVHIYPLDRNLKAQWTTKFPAAGKWTFKRLTTVQIDTCAPSPYWWIAAQCTRISYTENAGTDTLTIK